MIEGRHLNAPEADRLVLAELKKWGTHARPYVPEVALSELVGIRPASLRRALERLERSGLVVHGRCEGRAVWRYVEPAGERARRERDERARARRHQPTRR